MLEEWMDQEEAIAKTFRVELIVCKCGCNGRKTGPTIEANVGETIVVRLVNHLDEPMSIELAEAGVSLQPTRAVAPGASGEFRFLLVKSGRFRYAWGSLEVYPDQAVR